jgi:hypothetical protein
VWYNFGGGNMTNLEKLELSLMLSGLTIGLVVPLFGMNVFLTPVIILLGLGLTGLVAILADKPY